MNFLNFKKPSLYFVIEVVLIKLGISKVAGRKLFKTSISQSETFNVLMQYW